MAKQLEIALDGWKEWPTRRADEFARHWFKFYKSEYLCCLNENAKGIQFEVKEWDFRQYQKDNVGYEVSTSAELPSGLWPRFQMGFDNIKELHHAVNLILIAWEAMNKNEKVAIEPVQAEP